MKKILEDCLVGVFICMAVACVMFGIFCSNGHGSQSQVTEQRDTIVEHDTITINTPVQHDSIIWQTKIVRLPVAQQEQPALQLSDDSDSVDVAVPIVQRHYTDSLYEAWVSGPINPQLDSLKVFQTTRTIQITTATAAKKHWHVGPMIGIGMTGKGVQPFVGVGVTYSIINF